MAGKISVKKQDQVVILSGKDRGKKGRVLKVLPKTGMAVVEGIHFIKRHTRANQQKNIKGGIVERESPLHIAKLMVICPACSKPGRVARKSLTGGRRVRACRHCGAELDK
jgi:large subunit ribosomal protein L24